MQVIEGTESIKSLRLSIDPEFKSLIPPLSFEEFSQLEKNITEDGCRDAIVTWNGIIIDGHNRYEICTKHSIPFQTVEKNGFADRNDVRVWIINNQLGRRNILTLVKIDLASKKHDILELKEHAKSKLKTNTGNFDLVQQSKEPFPMLEKALYKVNTTKKIAEETDIGKSTVSKGLQILRKAPEELKQKALKGEVSINEAYKEIKKEEKKQARQQAESDRLLELSSVTKRYRIIHDDFRNADIEPESIDLILTDPPYPAEFLVLWQDLAVFAKKVLKPSGFLIAYSGELHLHKVFEYLSKELIYYWTVSLVHNGNTQIVHARNAVCQWKPILIFQKAPFKKIDQTFKDVLKGSGREKENHEWQQGEEELEPLINTFSKTGETILDPMAGSGTTLIMSLKLQRTGIAIEKDTAHIETIQRRVQNVTVAY
ncbi:DNA modification methylase [Candidatus Methanoperedens nitroreducens]|uniref:Type II methyltransferase n=1 Tax=Candidatus Methanoperedens nitratireducens TaxID=1392998 RepID=A0A062V2J7_9EURY|nr:DNA methyltransferase [Candidatus Methanoperedens nitroreducens]KCZ71592.1 DNA modification methylase [Candidatus Methanoperedens nitroreducens]